MKRDKMGKAFLKELLSDVSDWLKFAEAKNATIIGLGLAVLAIIFNYFDQISCWLVISIFGVLAFVIPCIITQIPFSGNWQFITDMTYNHFEKKHKDNASYSHLFYVDIFLRGYKNIEELISDYDDLIHEKTELDKEYIKQIYSISKNACIKYWFAEFSCKIILFEIFGFAVALLIA